MLHLTYVRPEVPGRSKAAPAGVFDDKHGTTFIPNMWFLLTHA